MKSAHPDVKEPDLRMSALAYDDVGKSAWKDGIPEGQFDALYGKEQLSYDFGHYDIDSFFGEIKDTPAGQQLLKQMASTSDLVDKRARQTIRLLGK